MSCTQKPCKLALRLDIMHALLLRMARGGTALHGSIRHDNPTEPGNLLVPASWVLALFRAVNLTSVAGMWEQGEALCRLCAHSVHCSFLGTWV